MKSASPSTECLSPRPRLGLFAVFLATSLLATALPAQAAVFNLTSDHVPGGAGTGPFGTVTLSQSGAQVNVDVALASGYSFVGVSDTDFQDFKFNATGVTLGDLVNFSPSPVLLATTGSFNGGGTGDFAFGLRAIPPTIFSSDITFTVVNATIADVSTPNALGNIFVAGILAPNGNSGAVAVGPDFIPPPPSVPDSGSTFLLLGLGLLGIGLVKSRSLRVV